MYLRFVFFFFCLFFLKNGLSAQSNGRFSKEDLQKLKAAEDTLAVLGYAIVNDSTEMNRFTACRMFIPKLVDALKVKNSFDYPFKKLQTISIIAPPDSSFRIFTWQLFVNDSTYRYYGAIQRNTPDLQLIAMKDKSYSIDDPAARALAPDEWYGALYYGIQPIQHEGETSYLLFGFDAYSFFEKQKIIDVLNFDDEGKPTFGQAVFPTAESPKSASPTLHRMLFTYSSGSTMKCNYDEFLDLILFDNLIQIPNPYGSGLTHVTDGSYHGFKITDKGLEFVDKVFDHVWEEAPSEEALPESGTEEKRDIFGRKVKKKE